MSNMSDEVSVNMEGSNKEIKKELKKKKGNFEFSTDTEMKKVLAAVKN